MRFNVSWSRQILAPIAYTIVVSQGLREEAPNCRPMRDMDGESIILPAQQQYYPRVEALRWHRENMFNAA
jgi:putative restriction endonuclease